MTTHDLPPARARAGHRRIARPLLTGLAATAVIAATALPAAADTPAGWEEAPDVSVLGFLLVLVGLPVGLALLITLLAVLPSLAREGGYAPGGSWRSDPEWFGSPTKGVAAADEVTPQQLEAGREGAGGTSGRW